MGKMYLQNDDVRSNAQTKPLKLRLRNSSMEKQTTQDRKTGGRNMSEFSEMTTENLKKRLDKIDRKILKCNSSTLLWLYEQSIKLIVIELKKRGKF